MYEIRESGVLGLGNYLVFYQRWSPRVFEICARKRNTIRFTLNSLNEVNCMCAAMEVISSV